MKILILDNYDSFTYNLVQYVQEIIGRKVDVFRNDAITLEEVDKYDYIILSPGPGLPKDAGIMPALIKRYAESKQILGVCLGHQAIGEAFGAQLHNLKQVYHGLATQLSITDESELLFHGLPQTFDVGRYHSWAIKKEKIPKCLQITAEDEKGAIMAIRHKTHNLRGVQFHPESIMTEYGKDIIRNFLYQEFINAEDSPAFMDTKSEKSV